MRIVFSLEELRKAELAKHSHLNPWIISIISMENAGSHKSMRSRNGGSHIVDPFNWQCCQGRQIACQLADGKRQNLSKKRNTMKHIQMHLEFEGFVFRDSMFYECSMSFLDAFLKKHLWFASRDGFWGTSFAGRAQLGEFCILA